MSDGDERECPGGRGPVSRAIGLASELGIAMGLMAAAMLLGALALGRWLDRALGSSPWLTIILLLTGAISSQIVLYRMAANSVSQLNQGAQHALDGAGLRRATRLAATALLLAVAPALLGIGLGFALDRLLGTAILLTVLLALVGFVAGMVLLLRLVRAHHSALQGED
jgi:F0F1-type ATP synthase assembly protein I